MAQEPVLIVGAGPTGLNLALSLARRGTSFRLISEDKGPGQHSRAMAVHARTLEFYRQYGFADDVVAKGIVTAVIHLREADRDGKGREVLTLPFKDLGGDISPYPFVLTFPQDDHEKLLLEKLSDLGVSVEWNTRLTAFAEGGGSVQATLSHKAGPTEQIEAEYLCGCDGAHSQVRQTLALDFPGGTYDQLFFVADVKVAGGFDRDFHINLGEHILVLMLPVRSTGMQRLIGLVPPALSSRRDLGFEDIRQDVEALVGVTVTEVNWFSHYRVHHRVAAHFRVGRAFLAGDAGHIHSPVGGQGMNTGIGDAVNLGWKLAQVLQNRADASILDTYECERIGFARTLVQTTDRAFTPMTAGGIKGELVRRVLAPLVFMAVSRFEFGRHTLFRTLSQTRIHYEDSPLSEGKAGELHGGDRLPWVGGGPENKDNFDPLRTLDWQVHVYGEPAEALRQACTKRHLPLHAFTWSDQAKDKGFARDAAYLVRPDGYIALAAETDSAGKLEAYWQRHGLRMPG